MPDDERKSPDGPGDPGRTEAALAESEGLFRTIFETCPDPININRLRDGRFIMVNDRFLELSGYERNEVIGKTAIEINIWHDLEKREEFFSRIYQEKKVKDIEARFRRRDGSILTALVSASLISYQDEPHLLAVTQDITELKKAEQDLLRAHMQLAEEFAATNAELQESQIKFSALVDALLVGVYMCEGDDIIFINQQFGEIFGYDREELLSMNITDLIHPDDRGKFNTICMAPTPVDSVEGEYEIRGIRKNNDIIYLWGRNTVIQFNGRESLLGNVTDITKRKKAERELLQSEKDLRILSAQLLTAEERERRRIAHDIHDSIGQALSAIKFSVENSLAAIGERSIPAAVEALEKIIPLTRQSIEEVRRIIMDLHPSTLDDLGLIATISWFCREYESVYKPIHIEKHIQVKEDDIQPSLKTVIYRILQEALNNAAKHSKTETIRLHLRQNDRVLELLIEDSGQGFDIGEAQVRQAARKGMGLASMKERAQLSGGVFSIRSGPGKGTVIHVSWPAKRDED